MDNLAGKAATSVPGSDAQRRLRQQRCASITTTASSVRIHYGMRPRFTRPTRSCLRVRYLRHRRGTLCSIRRSAPRAIALLGFTRHRATQRGSLKKRGTPPGPPRYPGDLTARQEAIEPARAALHRQEGLRRDHRPPSPPTSTSRSSSTAQPERVEAGRGFIEARKKSAGKTDEAEALRGARRGDPRRARLELKTVVQDDLGGERDRRPRVLRQPAHPSGRRSEGQGRRPRTGDLADCRERLLAHWRPKGWDSDVGPVVIMGGRQPPADSGTSSAPIARRRSSGSIPGMATTRAANADITSDPSNFIQGARRKEGGQRQRLRAVPLLARGYDANKEPAAATGTSTSFGRFCKAHRRPPRRRQGRDGHRAHEADHKDTAWNDVSTTGLGIRTPRHTTKQHYIDTAHLRRTSPTRDPLADLPGHPRR